MSVLRRPAWAWGFVILWAGAIWIGSSLNIGEYSPLTKFGPDKVGHFVEFGFLAFLAANALLTLPGIAAAERGRRNAWLLAVLIATLWGIVDEIHQIWVPTRNSDPFDALADLLGAMVGAWLLLYWIERDRNIPEAVDGKP